jgi:hypothetical protein
MTVDKVETKKFPEWKNALDIILARFNAEGYGIEFTHEEILDMLDMEIPKIGTQKEFRDLMLKKMAHVEALKDELLRNFNLCLSNMRGVGYRVVHPNDQVKIEPEKQIRKAQKSVRYAARLLTNVDVGSLDKDARDLRDHALQHIAMLQNKLNTRNLRIEETKEQD